MKKGLSYILDKNSSLILEGGGLRGVFTCGVLDNFMDRGIKFPFTIGVSAGACNGLSYMSGQKKRAKYSNIDLLEKYDYYEGDYYYGDDDWGEYSEILFGGYIPLGVNLKGYLTKKFAVNPYLECSLGAFVGIGDFSGETGFHCRVGAGIEYKRFNVGIGYNALVEYGFPLNMGYVNLGFRFGK